MSNVTPRHTYVFLSLLLYLITRGTRSQVSISPEALEPRVLRKGIFTKDVEDQAAIAKRLSHAVNDGFSGTIAMAS